MLFSCSFDVTCWKRADLFVLLYVMFSCAFATFSYDVFGQVRCLIVLITDFAFFLTLLNAKTIHLGSS